MRELATIRRVDEVTPIEGADAIECVKVGGWRVVAKKNEMKEDDLIVFFEIDSFLPSSDERFAFLMQRGTKTLNGVEGFRLRTVKLRGQVSQGLALPLSLFPELEGVEEDTDVSETLNIIKYERPEPLRGKKPSHTKGDFPWFISKTDEPRIQNVKPITIQQHRDTLFVPTLKLDGSSTTVYYVKDERYFIKPEEGETEQVGICSRNLLLDPNKDPDNHFVRGAIASDLFEIVAQIGRDLDWNLALQAETIGEGIVRSWEQIEGPVSLVFSIYDIDRAEYLPAGRLMELIKTYDIPSTMFYDPIYAFRDYTQDELIAMADGPSLKNPIREGLVFKAMDGSYSFKSISNKFLLKGGE